MPKSIQKQSSAVQTAEPYPFTKNLHPSKSRSHYLAKNGLFIRSQTALLISSNVWFQKISIPPPTDGQWKFLGGRGAKR